MEQRFKFCHDGFFVFKYYANPGERMRTVFMRFDDILSMKAIGQCIEVTGRNINLELWIGCMPECRDLGAYAAEIEKHWINFHSGHIQQGRSESLKKKLDQLIDAIQHLPVVEIAGEEAQKAGEDFKSRIKKYMHFCEELLSRERGNKSSFFLFCSG